MLNTDCSIFEIGTRGYSEFHGGEAMYGGGGSKPQWAMMVAGGRD